MKTTIATRIYRVNDEQVLFDFQLPELLNTDIQTIRTAITKNRNRFPSDFIMEFDKEEWTDYKRANPELQEIKLGKRIPNALTAGGIIQLCRCMKNNYKTNQIMVQVIRMYVKMKKYQPVFFKEDKELRKHERNSNLDLYVIYNIITDIAN